MSVFYIDRINCLQHVEIGALVLACFLRPLPASQSSNSKL